VPHPLSNQLAVVPCWVVEARSSYQESPRIGYCHDNSARSREVVRVWFQEAGLASLDLPSGWVGRPYDSLHQLTWSEVRGTKVFLELDNLVHLIVTAPTEATVEGSDLLLTGFTQLVFDRQDYGSKPDSHAEIFTAGVLRFAGQGRGLVR